ncbi:MAG: calcium/proton exchanger [Armatimonadetes bacterium]|nr:calcium/proton exchanger [Armatimonadota bacterium]
MGPVSSAEAATRLSRKDLTTLALALGATVVAGLLRTGAGPVVAFLAAAAALSLMAVVVGHATDQLGSRMSPGATGVLQSALGNLPELMVCIFSLRAGLMDVVKGALVGSILANSVLVLGLAVLFGGLKHGTQRFHSGPPRMIAILMLLACTALVMPTLAFELHTPAAAHESSLSLVCSVVLLLVFLASLSFFLKGNPAVTPEESGEKHAGWPLWLALVILALSGVGAAFVSEWFVAALEPATKSMGISEAFTGFVIVAIAGNAIENLVGIQLAMKNKPDYAMSVILNSSLQIALALVPVLVMASFFVGPAPMTLVLSPLLVTALIFAALIPALIVFDGETIWLEGAALVGLYVLIAAAFWWG